MALINMKFIINIFFLKKKEFLKLFKTNICWKKKLLEITKKW